MDIIQQIQVNYPDIEKRINEYVSSRWNCSITPGSQLISERIQSELGHWHPAAFAKEFIESCRGTRNGQLTFDLLRGTLNHMDFILIRAGDGNISRTYYHAMNLAPSSTMKGTISIVFANNRDFILIGFDQPAPSAATL